MDSLSSAAVSSLVLLLLDSRSPAGGHSHSGGLEAAVTAGYVRDVADAEEFCNRRVLARIHRLTLGTLRREIV